MGIYRFTTFSTMARTAVSMRCSACCRMAVQVRSASLRRAASAACPASPARCMASFSSTFTAFCASRTKPPQRWYYHCDKLGLIVWQDMVNGGEPYRLWFVTYLTNVFQPLLRRLQLVYFFTVQFTHRLS